MPYCRKCGAKLDEDARFCRVCGTPVQQAPAPAAAPVPPTYRYRRRGPWPIIAGVVIGVLVLAFLVAALAFVPVQSVSFSREYSLPNVAGVDAIKLTFDADTANVNVIPADMPNNLVRLDVSASGSVGLFGNSAQPVKVTLDQNTVGSTATVTSHVTSAEGWPMSFNLGVACNLYINRQALLDLNVATSVGSVVFTPVVPVTFQGLTLRSTTGTVEASVSNLVTLPQNSSFTTTTGSAHLTWVNAQVIGDSTVRLASTTGSVELSITQHQDLAGAVTINAQTTTGSVNPTISIRGDVGAQITSHTSFGSINVNAQNFNGNKSPVYSSNYPAAHNFLIDCGTTTGSVNVNANYQSSGSQSNTPTASSPEQIRDAVMTYIQTNHPATANYMPSLPWTGGRATPEGLVGYETYVYTTIPQGVLGGQGWTVTIGYPVVPNPIYQISANYTQAGIQAPVNISWAGTWQNGAITETNYSFIHYFDATPTP